MNIMKVGIIGCGNISGIYLHNNQLFNIFEIIACADLEIERAKQQAKKYNIPYACTVAELLAMEEIQLVINLTVPLAHAEVCLSVLEAGKHIYVEKPLAVTREDGLKILHKAKEKGLLVGGAPDTFLGGGIQTCRKLIDDGLIGEPVAGTASIMSHGPEGWHPDPTFFYQIGGGPMFDMGPYYLSTLIHLLGPIHRVSGSTSMALKERLVTSETNYGKKIKVNIPTHISGVLDFENGAVVSLTTSFDVWHHHVPNIEIYGTAGSLVVPDPNTFDGPVYVRRKEDSEWLKIPLTHGFIENSRGIGVADMANGILNNTSYRANGDVMYHVLEVMHGFHDASQSGQYYELQSTCEQPKPLPCGINQHNFGEMMK
ncbi:Gfo/Idh/MocA family protein [Chengkuizengella sediminis]|uniref:Gfo/Idh/MocA family protein n=1 Tax=Chengkuizengella sediminis TaxID=1885917 RepID=UPI00138A1D51|nr:Gfo/Idh/MocA family oxidoreductase [Chengkuizengella sediminis]NDI36542.1 Gfo/Idh/MocA family oxidoreductase [Chengkuizengella sediminis]